MEQVKKAIQLVVGTLAIGAVMYGAYVLTGMLFHLLTGD